MTRNTARLVLYFAMAFVYAIVLVCILMVLHYMGLVQ